MHLTYFLRRLRVTVCRLTCNHRSRAYGYLAPAGSYGPRNPLTRVCRNCGLTEQINHANGLWEEKTRVQDRT